MLTTYTTGVKLFHQLSWKMDQPHNPDSNALQPMSASVHPYSKLYLQQISTEQNLLNIWPSYCDYAVVDHTMVILYVTL